MMVRGAAKNPARFGPFVRALMPFLVAQWLLLVLVLLAPKLVHFGENVAANTRNLSAPVSNEEIDKRLRDMIPAPPAYSPK